MRARLSPSVGVLLLAVKVGEEGFDGVVGALVVVGAVDKVEICYIFQRSIDKNHWLSFNITSIRNN